MIMRMEGNRMALHILLIGQLLVGVLSTNRDDFILETSAQCRHGENDVARVSVVTDLPVQVFADCANGDFQFEKTDPSNGVHLHLDIRYSDTGADGCVFYKRAHTRTYFLHVQAIIVEGTGGVRQYLDQSTVSCSFNTHGQDRSSSHEMAGSYLAPMEVQSNVGPESVSSIVLTIVDISGDPVSNATELLMNKLVQLVAVSDGAGQEAGVRPVSCDLVGINDGRRYPLLRAGCGDGLVLPKSDGFITAGLVSKSGLFPMYNVARDKVIKFACNFTLCNSSCDGSSCANERKRRSLNDPALIQDIEILTSNHHHHPTGTVLSDYRDGLLRSTTVVLSPTQVKGLLALATVMALLAIGLPIFACVIGLRRNKVVPVT